MSEGKLQAGGPAAVSGGTVGFVNTGLFELHVHLKIDQVLTGLDQLCANLLAERPLWEAMGTDEALRQRLLPALRLLPRVADQDQGIRAKAYATSLLARQGDDLPELAAARDRYVALSGRLLRDPALTPGLRLHQVRTDAQEPPSRPLRDVAEALDEHPALVLLGGAGMGKSTVLQRLALDAARSCLAGEGDRLPLLLTLADDQTQAITDPEAWVAAAWERRAPGRFLDMVAAGRVLLLLDGYNEMARLADDGKTNQRAQRWRRFLNGHFGDKDSRCRAVVASRDRADYSITLGLPQVHIEPLTSAQVKDYLSKAGLDAAGSRAFETEVARLGLQDMTGRPLDLSILVAGFDPAAGSLPPNRGRLFHDHAEGLLQVEAAKGSADWMRLDRQLAALAELCFALQEGGESTVLPRDRLLALVPTHLREEDGNVAIDAGALLRLAESTGLLVRDEKSDVEVPRRFSHQMFQEAFAAQAMLARWRRPADRPKLTGLWQAPRSHAQMPDPKADGRGEWDPLPEPPDNGWQQTTILAAGLAEDRAAFLRDVAATSPALAARCLLEGGIQVPDETRADLRRLLLRDLEDPGLHRRTRIQAGRLLGSIGDPRFVPVTVGGITAILPPLVAVPGGRARLGRHRWLSLDYGRFADEHSPCTVQLAPFHLGRYPVTNAEYACFVAAGGYDDESLWTPKGWDWRMGRETTNEALERYLRFIAWRADDPAGIDRDFKAGRMSEAVAQTQKQLIAMSEEDRRGELQEWYQFRSGRRDGPLYDDDPSSSGPNQPRIGVSWFEAQAYCLWLTRWIDLGRLQVPDLAVHGSWQSVISRSPAVRLPTEAEWEWAAGGPGHRRYPWGHRWDEDRANALDGRVLRSSPAGAYPAGRAACGADDMAGNVWEWTSSLYKPYPYDAGDGREEVDHNGPRVLRGGSWHHFPQPARSASRNDPHPDARDGSSGFRVVVRAAPIP